MSSGAGDGWIWWALGAGALLVLIFTAVSWNRLVDARGRRGDLVSVAVGTTILLLATVLLLRTMR